MSERQLNEPLNFCLAAGRDAYMYNIRVRTYCTYICSFVALYIYVYVCCGIRGQAAVLKIIVTRPGHLSKSLQHMCVRANKTGFNVQPAMHTPAQQKKIETILACNNIYFRFFDALCERHVYNNNYIMCLLFC